MSRIGLDSLHRQVEMVRSMTCILMYLPDLDECAIGLNTCDVNAACFNVPGSFMCRCNPGFRGDGRQCASM